MICIIIVFCLLMITSIYADTTGTIESEEVIVQYDEPLKNASQEVVRLYPRIKHELENILGWKIDFRPVIVLIRESTRFQEIISNQYIIAVAVPSQNLIVMDYSKMNVSPFTLEVTLKHEMCHLLLGKNIPGERIPRWLNEGFCQWVTGGVAELMIDSKLPTLSKASLSNRLIPLESLTRNFPGNRDELILAYEESKSIVDYLVTEYGRSSVIDILGYLREGDTIDTAATKVISLKPNELEERWSKHLRGQITWIGYLSANIYTILLFAAALLTVCGFFRAITRRHRRDAEAEEDDEYDAH